MIYRFMLLLLMWLESNVAGGVMGQSSDWTKVEIGIIGPASEDILHSAIEETLRGQRQGLLIVLDTPGGSLESTRKMVKEIMGAPFPVVVWVGPAGSHASSAGAFITLAAHVAAMSNGANIGAAHPVDVQGKDIATSDMRTKVENDTAAFMESIATNRGRNVEVARSFVLNSLSMTAEEALDDKVIDLLASTETNLLKSLDGRNVQIADGKEFLLQTKSSQLIAFEKTLRQRLLEILSNPNLFYLLFVAGLLGLSFEMTHPGVIFPGVMGAICLILALIAQSTLPISFGALLLIVLSVAFMIGEIFLPAFGVLGVGGVVGFVIGSLLLVDPNNEQGLSVSPFLIIPAAVTMAGLAIFLSLVVLKNQRNRIKFGPEGMVGMEAKVLVAFINGHGRVAIQGENWEAWCDLEESLSPGMSVQVESIQGLKLKVKASLPPSARNQA